MFETVLLFGVVIVLGCIFLLIRAQHLLVLAERILATRWIYLAALLRLLLGAAMIASAHAFKYPQAITLLGWLLAFGGVVLIAVPQPVWVNLAGRLADLPLGVVRLLLLLGLCFGGFIVYAAL
ncbi:MAG: hypothetical protein V7709_12295 [Halioglobus sp.]